MEDGNDRGRKRRRVQDVRIDTTPSIMAQEPRQSNLLSSSSGSSWSGKIDFSALTSRFEWITENWSWSRLKPVIRCAVAAWLAAVLFVIPKVERWMGMASFLILVGSFLSPPSDPFVAVLEREWRITLFVCIAWAWSCLGIKFASLARSHIDFTPTFLEVLDGRYIEAAPSVIVGVFVALGSIFFLFIKAREGPGPYFFASIFGCICLDVTLTTAALFPYPYYSVGTLILVPLGLHSVIALVTSLLVFPLTMSALYASRLQAVHTSISSVLTQHAALLALSPDDLEFTQRAEASSKTHQKADEGLVDLAAAARLLPNDLVVSRFAPGDFTAFQGFARRLVGRVHGMGLYFTLIDPEKARFPGTPGTSVPGTPAVPGTPIAMVSRQESPERDFPPRPSSSSSSPVGVVLGSPHPLSPSGSRGQLMEMARFSPTHSRTPSNQPSVHGKHHHHHQHTMPHHILHHSLLNLSLKARSHRRAEHVVGVFESQKYLNLEAKHLRDPRHFEWVHIETELLEIGCAPLLGQCNQGLAGVDEWFGSTRRGRFMIFGKEKVVKERANLLEKFVELRTSLSAALKQFREHDRMRVIEPYYPAVEHPDDESYGAHVSELPPHRHLFHCYTYQYHLIQVASIIAEMLDEIIRLEGEREHLRLWTPASHFFHWNSHQVVEDVQHGDDDDPDIIQGAYRPDIDEDLGMAAKRDPDALPPRNVLESALNLLYHGAKSLTSGNSLFAMKAGIVSAALCLPALLKASSEFAYKNRWVWAIIMGQLTLARFRGDTTFGLAARVVATFAGGVIGMVMWYIASGGGIASPYSFAAVCGVCFPLFFMVGLYAPIPPITRIVAFVTSTLVIGYSYADTHQLVPGSPGSGWDVAWRRFVLVTIGVVAAFIASLLPPTMTLRRYQRSLLSTTCTELGAIYCAIISFANTDHHHHTLHTSTTGHAHTSVAPGNGMGGGTGGVQDVITSLVATRAKLRRSAGLNTNIVYEFSLRGRWPRERYQQILDGQMAMTYALSHLVSVTEHLEASWTRAFLRRTRFLDPDFQGDVLAVITMISSSLRTGTPLPQVTPCPLVDRFMMRYHGLDVIHRDAEEDYGLPRLLTVDTLRDEEYMTFCVGISAAYSLLNRLDRLMLATKEIVGEQYHIHGVGVSVRYGGLASSNSASASASFAQVGSGAGGGRPGRDV